MHRPSLIAGTLLMACLATAGGALLAQDAASIPPATSPPKVKELVALLQAKKMTAYAARDPEVERHYVAVLLVPGAQLLVVEATHARPTDIEYYLYRSDHMNAYMDLNSSVNSTSKVFIEDTLVDGLVARPAKNQAPDSITIEGKPQVFDGLFADPKKRNDKRMPLADYAKSFGEADRRYTRLLDRLLAELKR